MLLGVHTNIHTYLVHQGEVPQAHHITTNRIEYDAATNGHGKSGTLIIFHGRTIILF